IQASGRGGRLTKGDVLQHLEKAATDGTAATVPEIRSRPQLAAAPQPEPASRPAAGSDTMRATRVLDGASGSARAPQAARVSDERVPMTHLRQRIAERLVQAQHTAAILTTFNEVDMQAVIELRARHKARFAEVHGVSLGFMSFFARACIGAMRDLPVINAQID